MEKKQQIIARPDNHIMEFNGMVFKQKTTKYKKIDGIEHIDKIIYEEIDIKALNKKCDYIKNKLVSKVPPHRIVEEMIKGMDTKEINRIHKLLKGGAKVKRQDGCLGIKIDGGKHNNAYLQIFG